MSMGSKTREKLTGFITAHVCTIQTFLFFLAIALIVGTSHLLNADEGIILNGAWKIYGGQTLYADFFEIVAPGSYYLAFLAMKVLGPSYFAVRTIAILLLALSAFALADITRRLGANERNARIAGTLWIFCLGVSLMLINHNTWSSEIAIIGLALFLRAIDETRRPVFFGVAGIMVGLVPVFLQTKGVALLVILSVVCAILGIQRMLTMKQIVAFVVGAIIPAGSTLLVWSPATLWYHLFAWPLDHYQAINNVSAFPLLIASVLFLVLLIAMWVQFKTKRALLAVIAVTQCALYASVLSQPEFFHTALVSFGIPLLIGLYLQTLNLPRVTRGSPSSMLPIPILCALCVFAAWNMTNSINTPTYLRALNAHRTTTHQGIYCYPFLPNYYFEFQAKNPYPHSVLYTNYNTPDEFESNLDVLKTEMPALIFRGRALGEKFHYDWTNPHDAWIDEHYRIVQTGWVEILKRKDIE